jgi:hypothetical protein
MTLSDLFSLQFHTIIEKSKDPETKYYPSDEKLTL